MMETQNDLLAKAQDKFKADAATLQTPVATVQPTGGIFKTVVGGKTTFSDKGVADNAYTPGAITSAGLSMNPTPFAEQVATSYTPKPVNGISAARNQLTSYQNNLSATSDQMGQAAVSGIQPVEFDTSKGGNITQAAGLESDTLFNTPKYEVAPRIEGQVAQLTNLAPERPLLTDLFKDNAFAGSTMGRFGGNDYNR